MQAAPAVPFEGRGPLAGHRSAGEWDSLGRHPQGFSRSQHDWSRRQQSNSLKSEARARSSVGQSACFTRRRPQVRVLTRPPRTAGWIHRLVSFTPPPPRNHRSSTLSPAGISVAGFSNGSLRRRRSALPSGSFQGRLISLRCYPARAASVHGVARTRSFRPGDAVPSQQCETNRTPGAKLFGTRYGIRIIATGSPFPDSGWSHATSIARSPEANAAGFAMRGSPALLWRNSPCNAVVGYPENEGKSPDSHSRKPGGSHP